MTSWWVAGALGVALVLAVGWGAWGRRRLGALDQAVDASREVVDQLREGRLWVRAFREPGATEAADRLAASLNALARHLQEAHARRLRQDEAYRRLVADLSHDLRTPLTSIIGYVEALRTGTGRDPSRYLDIVASRAADLVRLVEDLLLLTRLEAGDSIVRPEPCDLVEVVRHACEPFREPMESKGVQFDVEIPPGPCPAFTDRTAIVRILSNLLENALQHAGAVRHVEVRLVLVGGRPGAAGPDGWTVEVTNDGEPIPPEEIPYVFERGSKGTRSAGSGLGLAIVRMLAEAHGGRAEVSSAPQARRTTFRIHMPAAPQSPGLDRPS